MPKYPSFANCIIGGEDKSLVYPPLTPFATFSSVFRLSFCAQISLFQGDMEAEFLATFNTASKAADAAAASSTTPAFDLKSGGGGGRDHDESLCLDALRGLKGFPVSSQLLISTQVGKSLRRLTKHPRKKIQAFASDLLQEWKQTVMEEANGCKVVANGKYGDDLKFAVKSETPAESKCLKSSTLRVPVARSDSIKVRKMGQNGSPQSAKFVDLDVPVDATANEGEEEKMVPRVMESGPVIKCNDPLRDRVREQLLEALSKVSAEVEEDIINDVKKSDPARVAVTVESALYDKWGKMNGAHKMKYRSIIFNIKDANNPDFRRKVLLGHVKPETLLNMTTEEMASKQRQLQNQQIKEKAMFECERGAAPNATTDQFKCGRCGQRRCTYYQMQTRSADEPMTTYVTCVNCNNRWKFC